MQSKRPFVLSNGASGIDRFDLSEDRQTLSLGYDCINDTGETRRRDAFMSILATPGIRLPPARGFMFQGPNADGSGTTARTKRIPTWPAGGNYIFFGCDITFDGIQLLHAPASTFGAEPASNAVLEAAYWNGSAWTTFWVFDSTRGGPVGAKNMRPFCRDGAIRWHSSQLTGWATTTINSTTLYYVRLVCKDSTGAVISPAADINVTAPGFTPLKATPVNSLISSVMKGRQALLIGHDRKERRSRLGGASLSTSFLNDTSPRPLSIVSYRGQGVFGQVAYPQWGKNTAGTWLAVGGAGSFGTSDVFTIRPRPLIGTIPDKDATYDFREHNPVDVIVSKTVAGGVLGGGIQPKAGATSTLFKTTDIVGNDGDFEDFILLCVVAGGVPQNEFRRITKSYTVAAELYFQTQGWTSAPTTAARFRILRPGTVVRIYGNGPDAQINHSAQTYEMPLTPTTTLPSVGETTVTPDAISTDDVTAYGDLLAMEGYIEVVEQLSAKVKRGLRWSSVVDTITGSVILTNGESGLLQYDGQLLQRFEADTDSDIALQLAGKTYSDLPNPTKDDASRLALSYFRGRPPVGKYLATYGGSFIVAGSTDYPFSIWNSFPGNANRIWPKINETQIRDEFGEPITGISVLGDRIYAFTRKSIHIGIMNDDTTLSFNPYSKGIGFVSHFAVVTVPLDGQQLLVGPALDGIYAASSEAPSMILDSWERLLENGINVSRLSQCVGTVFRSANLAIWAVTSHGSNVNDRLLVWDYVGKTWWVWRHPIGVSSLSTAVIGNKEVLLIGTDDGFVQALRVGATDDGTAIVGQMRSQMIQPTGPAQLDFTRFDLTVKTLGIAETAELYLYLNGKSISAQGGTNTYPLSEGLSSFGNAKFYSAGPPVISHSYAEQQYRTVSVNIPKGIRGNLIQWELKSSAQWRVRQAMIEAEGKSMRGKL